MSARARKMTVVAAVAGLVLVGCGKGGGGSTGSTAAAGGATKVSAKAYVAKLCSGFTGWQQAVSTRASVLSEHLSPSDTVQERKTSLADYLDGLVADTDYLIRSSEAAGIPDVSGGEAAAHRLTSAFQDVKSALQKARKKVDTLPTDVTGFQKATEQLGNDITDSLTGIGNSLSTLSQGDLDAAFNANPTCQKIASGGS
jgi:hypothetical protein